MKFEHSMLQNIDSDKASMLYRFQGGNSYPSFNIQGDTCKVGQINHYTYFSKSMEHHKYFVSKRLKQLINKMAFDEKGLVISNRNLADNDFYKKVIKDIASSDKVSDLQSLRFLVDSNFIELIEQNYEYNSDKTKGSKIIERVDRRISGGGYGIGNEWLSLFNSLTILYYKKDITRDNLITMLKAIRSGYKSKIESVEFLMEPTNQIIVNNAIYSDFTKFKIMESLEEILDKGLYKEDSQLGKKPTVMIKKITNDYCKLRDESLREIQKLQKR